MQKNLYIIRHCKATGQSPESPLTELGLQQATGLVSFFQNMPIDRIIASPFLRAIQTVEPLSEHRGVPIEVDERLGERILSTEDLPDWLTKLEETFRQIDLKLEGGESSREAMTRISDVIEEVIQTDAGNTVIVSHGNIISLLLKKYDPKFGFDCWKNLSNPDVYQIIVSDEGNNVERIWDDIR